MFYKVLDGVKVIEYGKLISAPFCAKIFADMGAEVIKIEQPCCGDDSRRMEPFMNDIPGLERSGLFQYLNMNKKGITLNPETATGRKILLQLLKGADVFIEAIAIGADVEAVVQGEAGGNVQAQVRGEVVLVVQPRGGSVVLAAADEVEPCV